MDRLDVFLAHALKLEEEASIRFDELADALDVHHQGDVAELFRKMAHYSRLHYREARDRASGLEIPALKSWEFQWPGDDSPEAAAMEDTHYMMTPHHALKVALASEKTGYEFYKSVHLATGDDAVRSMAAEFVDEEAEHVRMLEDMLTRYPEPETAWSEDLDPPASVD